MSYKNSLISIVLVGLGVVALMGAKTKQKKPAPQVHRFVLDVVGRVQTLELQNLKGKQVPIVITVDGGCSRRVKGQARWISRRGAVSEIDPDGEVVRAQELILTPQKGCNITIRLATPKRQFAWVRESGCIADCPLSDQPMRK
jgi:hypothetical protein